MTGFNLRSIKTTASFSLPIKDADGNNTGVFFELAAPTHPARKAIDMASRRRMIRASNKTGRLAIPDPEESEADRPKHLAACTLGWSGYIDESGQPVPFSTQAALSLYEDPEMQWLADQVEDGLGNKQLYTKPASGS
jgi:hypothetical protein